MIYPTPDAVYARKYRFLLVSALAAFIATLDASIVNVSLPTLSREFSAEVDVIAWVVLAYSLAITSTLLMVGRLAVKRGYRLVYLTGFGLFTMGSLFCALSGSIDHLIGSRVIQGFGASFLMASGPALVTRSFPARERGKAMGIIGTAVGVGLMSGPPLGGYLVSTAGWSSIFLINIPVGIFGLLYSARLLKILPADDPQTRIDYIGGIFQAVAVVSLLLYFNRLNSPAWPAEVKIAVLALSIIAGIVFLWREIQHDHPLLGLSIFSHKQFTIAIATMMIAFVCTSSGLVLIPFYLEEILRLAPREVGLVLVTIPICTLVMAPLSGRVSDAIGYRFLTTFGLVIFVTGVFWIATLGSDSGRIDVVLRLVVIGVGLGMFQAPNSSAMMSAVPPKIVGIASGLLAVARNLGISGGVAVSTAIFTFRKELYGQSMPETDAFVASFGWVVSAFGFATIAAILISATRKNRPPKHHDGIAGRY